MLVVWYPLRSRKRAIFEIQILPKSISRKIANKFLKYGPLLQILKVSGAWWYLFFFKKKLIELASKILILHFFHFIRSWSGRKRLATDPGTSIGSWPICHRRQYGNCDMIQLTHLISLSRNWANKIYPLRIYRPHKYSQLASLKRNTVLLRISLHRWMAAKLWPLRILWFRAT